MQVGIEKLNLYAGRCSLDIKTLAEARQQNPTYVTEELLCHTRSIYPPYEDGVTLAVNAAKRLLSPDDIEDVELLIVGTESAVDMGKPISTWVHRFCGLPANCRNFEIKHACYGSTGAMKMAAFWVASGVRPGKKALVINSDLSRQTIGDPIETVQGGCSVAALISATPHLLSFEIDKAGYWTHEIADTFRPTTGIETINDETSLFSYLDALDGAFSHYEEIVGPVDYQADFKKYIYHAPFPGMTFQAHRTMLNRFGRVKKKEAKLNWEQKVAESLYFAKRVGTAYGGSTILSMLGLLASAENLEANDPISVFAYGSGCQSEFYLARVGVNATQRIQALDIDQHLNSRKPITVAEYEINEYAREAAIDKPNYTPSQSDLKGIYEEQYAGQDLLVLRQVDEGFHRTYEWS